MQELAGLLGVDPVEFASLMRTPFGADFRYDAEAGWTGPCITELDELAHVLA